MSNVIKFTQYVALEDLKIVEPAPSPVLYQEHSAQGMSPEQQDELQQLMEMKEQLLADAETFAEEQVRAAMEESAALKEQAQTEIEQWWQDRRAQDREASDHAREEGFRQGYREGLQQAEQELQEKYETMLQEASQILEQAYVLKQQIVQESEPFLIELSCSIAEKIIHRQLSVEPEWVVSLIQQVLARRKEKGIITLCVSPAHFSYLQDARDELLLHIDSQAELQIIPDATVQDHGCVVRSTFGSIDARIDTQLNEIKNALTQLAVRGEGT